MYEIYANHFVLYESDNRLRREFLYSGMALSCKELRIIIIMVIFQCYFSGEHIALSIKKTNNNGVNIELGKTKRLKALCMMQINT